ncbi:MAG TPA: IS607 family transposase [Candidatus Nanopelagicaceae bacterium]|nr:IS607 family transposase [Candidatus Nanopelagicaceae bacterium]
MSLKEWAREQGVHPVTASRWFRDGKLPGPVRRVGGLILVDAPGSAAAVGRVAVYARVSSADQRSDLDRQVARVTAWATGEDLSVGPVVTEVGSALNGKRRRFLALLRDESATIVVEHRDWFARFGVEYVEAALSAPGRRLELVDSAEVDDDLVRDVTEIPTSMCARVDGRRAAVNRARRAMEPACDSEVLA